jgi:hypothetical protein
VEAAAAVLPCGHVLCCSCADALAARLPTFLPQQQRRISCPSCRCRTHVSDMAYVDSGRSSTYSYIRTDSNMPGQQQQGVAAAGDPCSPLGSPKGGGGRRRSSSCSGTAGEGGEAGEGAAAPYMWQAEQQLLVQGSYGEWAACFNIMAQPIWSRVVALACAGIGRLVVLASACLPTKATCPASYLCVH